MRDVETRYALLQSDNIENFSFPYGGGSKLGLWLRKSSPKDQVVFFEISSGQIVCDECKLAVKFDDDKVAYFEAAIPDGGSKFVMLRKSGGFLNRLRTSKKIFVELKFYQEGTRQFLFSPQGLAWG